MKHKILYGYLLLTGNFVFAAASELPQEEDTSEVKTILNEYDDQGNTYFINCIKTGDIPTLISCISLGAKLTLADRKGYTPLIWTILLKKKEFLQYLLMLAPKPAELLNYQDPQGLTPLMHAIKIGATEIAQLLLLNPACDITLRDIHHRTALSYASHLQNQAIIQSIAARHGALPSKPVFDHDELDYFPED